MADTYENYLSTLSGITKTKYDKKVMEAYPTDVAPLTGMLTLEPAQKIGGQFQFPIDLTYDDSTTYAAAGAGAYSFNDTAPGQMKPALVDASNYSHRGFIDFETIARTSDGPDEGAMENAVDRMMFRMNTGLKFNLEIDFWYGGTNIGVIQSVTVGNGSNGYAVGAAGIVITNASFAPGLFIGRKGSRMDCYAINSTTGRPTSTKRNANAALVISAFSLSTRTVTVTGNSSDLAALAAGDGLLKYGSKGQGTQGLDYTLTSSGTSLYGIDTSEYDLFEPNVVSNGSLPLTLKRLYAHMSNAISKGLGQSGVDVWLNPDVFGDLLSNEVVLRRYLESTSGKASTGFRDLSYDSQVGKMTFKPFIGIKRGEVFVGPTSTTLSKVGAREPGLLNFSGVKDLTQYLKPIENKAGCEAQYYGHLGLVNKRPAVWTKIKDVVAEASA